MNNSHNEWISSRGLATTTANYGLLNPAARGRIDLAAHWPDMLRLAASIHARAVTARDAMRVAAPGGTLTQLGDALAHFGPRRLDSERCRFEDSPRWGAASSACRRIKVMGNESDVLQQRLKYLTDYMTVTEQQDKFLHLIRTVVSSDELVAAVATAFSIGNESAQILLDLPIRQWGPEGARRRTAEIDALRRKLSESA